MNASPHMTTMGIFGQFITFTDVFCKKVISKNSKHYTAKRASCNNFVDVFQIVNRFVASSLSNLLFIYRLATSCFTKLQQICK